MRGIPKHPNMMAPNRGPESVWDYPRPPGLESVSDRLHVIFTQEVVADTIRGYRILETSHPPVYYFPPSDVRWELLVPAPGQSFCEFKGIAACWTLEVSGARAVAAAWSYTEPTERFRQIKNSPASYAFRVDTCWVGDERVVPQDGDFYGGWITARIVNPFKVGPCTRGW